jgi:ubiquinone/menaquinone biosynthesis C-methylase UbiE
MFPKKNQWTGERLETFVVNETMIEHLHRYALSKKLVKNLNVLDIASGEGYGSYLLSKEAKTVIGVDIDKTTIQKAQQKYNAPNLSYIQGSAAEIPLENGTIDIVVSFETIEHHDQHHKMMAEIKRVLKPNGLLIISTPDKKQYSDIPNYKNPFHIKELYENEFKDLIKKYFTNQFFLHQQSVFGSLIFSEKETSTWNKFEGNYQKIDTTDFQTGTYIIAIASDTSLQNISFDNSFWSDKDLLFSNTSNNIKQSFRYKLGDSLLKPFSPIIKLWKSWQQ